MKKLLTIISCLLSMACAWAQAEEFAGKIM